jgi:hypothetical protein
VDRLAALQHRDEFLDAPGSRFRGSRILYAIQDGVPVRPIKRVEEAGGVGARIEGSLEISGNGCRAFTSNHLLLRLRGVKRINQNSSSNRPN